MTEALTFYSLSIEFDHSKSPVKVTLDTSFQVSTVLSSSRIIAAEVIPSRSKGKRPRCETDLILASMTTTLRN